MSWNSPGPSLVVRRCGAPLLERGREHAFAAITCYADFAEAVPVQTYETLPPYIEDQERTGAPALNAERPVMYARTSGTTGEAKLIPILRETIQQHRRSQAIQSYVQFSADARAYYGRFLAIVSPAEEATLESGTPYGSTSGSIRSLVAPIVSC